MSAIVNIFDSAFNDNHRTIKVDSDLRIEEVENLDWENTLIYVNGFERKKEYKLRDGDVATLRQFPSNQGSGLRNFWQGAGWLFMPVTSTITYFVTGSDKGAILALGDTIDSAIRDKLKQDSTDDIGQGEQLPTISGAKNRSGANQPIPLLLGESMYTPITLAQSYTTIGGKDGEEQELHALYCLGYKNIDLKSVKLGIYQLTADEKNGTSGTLDCTNSEKRSYDVEFSTSLIPEMGYGIPLGGNIFLINVPALLEGNFESCRIKSYSVRATCWALKKLGDASTKVERQCTVSIFNDAWLKVVAEPYSFTSRSVTLSVGGSSGSSTTVTKPAQAYLFFVYIDSLVATVTEKIDTNHYPKENTDTRQGYYQELELQQTGSEVALYPQKVVQENFGTELMHPQGVAPLYMQPFSAKYPQKIQLEVTFQNLVHYSDKGEEESMSVDLCVGYSLDGGVTYLPFTNFTNPVSGSAISIEDKGTITDATGTYRKTRFKGHKNKQMRFVAEKQFSFGDVFNIPEGTVKCKNNVIEFKIWRDSVDLSITDSQYQSKCCFSAIRTWCYDYKATLKQYEDYGTESLVIQKPIIEKYRNMTARLGFKIRAGEELKGTIDELNVLMQSRARYCTITEENGETTYTWSGEGQQNPYALEYTKPTNNPASIALMVLQHEMLGEYAYPDEMIDLVSFGKFYEWCEQIDDTLLNSSGRKYTVNGVVSRQFKLIDLVNNILNCGHGKLVINGNKYGVVYDKPDVQPVMVLNNQNVLEAKNTKNFLEDIDGYSCKFIDCLNDYQEDTQIFVPENIRDPQSPDYKDPSEYKLESIELPYITDVKRAYRFCMYLLACRKLRPESWERKLGVDGALVDIGSLVSVQDDTIVVGIGDGAQIKEVNEESGNIVSIEVDYGFNVTDTTKVYGVTIQHADPLNGVQVRTYELASFATTGTKTTLTFAEPIDSATVVKPAENDIVSFGFYEKITTDAICLGKKSNNDGTYTLTLAPYQEDIYVSEYGTIPEYETNVTSPKDAGVEISDELPPITREDVNKIAEAVLEEGTDEPPSAPTGLSVIAEEYGIQIKWIPVEDNGINNTIKQYDVEISRDGGTTWIPFVSTYNSDAYYTFRRTASVPPVEGEYVDGYPEADDFTNWRFRVKAVNIYGYESTWLTTGGNVNTQKYGTWVIPALSATQEILDRTAIVKVIHNAPQRPLYGSQRLQLKIKRLGSDDPTYAQQFNTMLAITPDTQWYTPNFNDLVGYSDTEDNEPKYKTNGSGWYTTDLYQFSHTLPLIGQTPRIYKANNIPLLSNGVSIDNVEDSETIPESPSTGDLIRYTGTTTADYVHNGYYLYDGTAWTRLFSKFTKDVSDVNELPSSPTTGQVVHLVSDGFYYLYESGEWVQVFSKSNAVATTYQYSIQMTNESGNVTAMSEPVKITVLPTNISDIVHSHEHYKDLYVEKLSAISANVGMISEGGMGNFGDMLNCWALSDLSPQDSGVAGGVQKGTFRVGGQNEYFRVTPIDRNGNYKIELKAGNIELTSSVGNESSLDFTKGTYIYNDERDARLKLTQSGIVAEKLILTAVTTQSGDNPKQKGWYEKKDGKWVLTTDINVVQGKSYYIGDWQEQAKMIADDKGNMILTNSDDIPPFGYQAVDATIYHIEDTAHPENEEVESPATPSNPQSLSFTGKVEDVKQYDPILDTASSTKCFNGSVTKDISNWTGRVAFFTKSEGIKFGTTELKIDGTTETIPLPLTGYNEAMKETSTQDPNMRVGDYLGLNETQIQTGIFN